MSYEEQRSTSNIKQDVLSVHFGGVVSFAVPEDSTGSPGGGMKGATASVRHYWKNGGWEETGEGIAIRNLGR